MTNLESVPKLLRAIARGTHAQETQHDIILNAAADLIEQLKPPPEERPLLQFEAVDPDNPLRLEELTVNHCSWNSQKRPPLEYVFPQDSEMVVRKQGHSITVTRRKCLRLDG